MVHSEESIEANLKAIRELMNCNSAKSNANNDLLELTEDDLVDSQDEDAFVNDFSKENIDGDSCNMIAKKDNQLENLIIDAVRPLLKNWLDENLESIIRDIAKEEIRLDAIKNGK